MPCCAFPQSCASPHTSSLASSSTLGPALIRPAAEECLPRENGAFSTEVSLELADLDSARQVCRPPMAPSISKRRLRPIFWRGDHVTW